jgi:hypothetical protein
VLHVVDHLITGSQDHGITEQRCIRFRLTP